jgi:hypothetical protein
MTVSKQAALEKIEAMQTTKKPRRTAQKRARDSLVAERDRIALAWKRATEKVNAKFRDRFADAERALQAFERALSKADEQAPESE